MVQPDAAMIADLLHESMIDGKVPFLTVTSNSMRPLLRRGDQVGLSAAALQQLAPGDVIVVRDGRTFLTHRLVAIRRKDAGTMLLTRGDRPLALDPPWSPDCYVGRVTVLRRGGRVLSLEHGAGRWLNQHLGRLARFEARLFTEKRARPPARWVRRAFLVYAMLVAAGCRRLGQRHEQSTHI
ncbi:MAG: hypothetical protein ACOC8X_01985, partial [Chloroflexota bacterium]